MVNWRKEHKKVMKIDMPKIQTLVEMQRYTTQEKENILDQTEEKE